MRTHKEIKLQLDMAFTELERIESLAPIKSRGWERTKGYIDALEWVLNEKAEKSCK